jgi:hypothetical protein
MTPRRIVHDRGHVDLVDDGDSEAALTVNGRIVCDQVIERSPVSASLPMALIGAAGAALAVTRPVSRRARLGLGGVRRG